MDIYQRIENLMRIAQPTPEQLQELERLAAIAEEAEIAIGYATESERADRGVLENLA